VGSCIGVIKEAQETAQLQGMSASDKARAAAGLVLGGRALGVLLGALGFLQGGAHRRCTLTPAARALIRPPLPAHRRPQMRAAGGDVTCQRAEGADLKPTCAASCGSACEVAFDGYAARYLADTGIAVSPKERTRMLKGCARSCAFECFKGGKSYDFVVPWRR